MTTNDEADRLANETVVLGALSALLDSHSPALKVVGHVIDDGRAALVVRLGFMRSDYLLIVTMVPDTQREEVEP